MRGLTTRGRRWAEGCHDRHDTCFARSAPQHVLGEEKYTFVEKVRHPRSCTLLIKGASDYVIAQIKDAVRDGLRAVKNVMDDRAVVKGAGAFEVACAEHLLVKASRN